jgi:hypothetical protein
VRGVPRRGACGAGPVPVRSVVWCRCPSQAHRRRTRWGTTAEPPAEPCSPTRNGAGVPSPRTSASPWPEPCSPCPEPARSRRRPSRGFPGVMVAPARSRGAARVGVRAGVRCRGSRERARSGRSPRGVPAFLPARGRIPASPAARTVEGCRRVRGRGRSRGSARVAVEGRPLGRTRAPEPAGRSSGWLRSARSVRGARARRARGRRARERPRARGPALPPTERHRSLGSAGPRRPCPGPVPTQRGRRSHSCWFPLPPARPRPAGAAAST